MRSVLAPLLILSVLLGSAIAKTPDPPKNTTRSDNAHRLRDTLTNMEKELARAEQQKNKHFFNDVLTPNF